MGLKKIVKKVTGLGGGGGDGGSGGPPPPDLSQLEALRAKQQQAAQNFRQNMAGMQAEQDRASRMDARSQLAQSMQNIKQGAASRGLLYSGLKQSDEAKAAQGAAQNVATQSAATRADLEDQARGLEDTALNTGINIQNLRQGLAVANFTQAQKDFEARNKALASIGSSVGTVVGSRSGSR